MVGDLDKADVDFQKAYKSTEALLKRSPNNPDRLYDHAQSAFWAAYVPEQRKKYTPVETYYQEYITLADKLMDIEPDSLRSLQEQSYAYLNMGIVNHHQVKHATAYEAFQKTLPNVQKIAEISPDSITAQLDLANIYAWLADSALGLSRNDEAIRYRRSRATKCI